jgi:transposase InsO family protein
MRHLLIEVLRRPIESAQYTSNDYSQTLDDHGVQASIGTVGDAYDNAAAESFVDSFKTELIRDRVWRSLSQLELASSNTSPGSTPSASTPHSAGSRQPNSNDSTRDDRFENEPN